MNDIQTVLKSASESIAQLIGRDVEVFYRLKDSRVNVSSIWNGVLAVTGVSDQAIKGKARYKEVVGARQLFCYVAKRYTGLTFKEIAKHIGDRDHTTAIHSVQKMTCLLEANDDVALEMLSRIEAYLNTISFKQAS